MSVFYPGMTSEAFQRLIAEIEMEAAPVIAEMQHRRPLTGCWWSDGSTMVPFWQEYWRHERQQSAGEILEPEPVAVAVETPVAPVCVPSLPMSAEETLSLFFES